MKPSLEPIFPKGPSSFLVRQFEEEVFSAPYHYHPEFELTYIEQGKGQRFVGHSISPYTEGDLVLIGPNLPHCWKTDPLPTSNLSKSIVVQFSADFIGEGTWNKPEFAAIAGLLKASAAGIQFTRGETDMGERLRQLLQEKVSFQRLILLLTLLQELATIIPYSILESGHPHSHWIASGRERLDAVLQYMSDHFTGAISLEGAAMAANMTPTSFCKYFKRISRKTFMEMVTDWRIEYARKLLISTNRAVSDIGLETGFRDISNFHRAFSIRQQCSPLQYRKKYQLLGTATK